MLLKPRSFFVRDRLESKKNALSAGIFTLNLEIYRSGVDIVRTLRNI